MATYRAAEGISIRRHLTIRKKVAHAREGLGALRRHRRHRLRRRLVRLGLASPTVTLYIESGDVVVRHRVLLAGPTEGPLFFGQCLWHEKGSSASATR